MAYLSLRGSRFAADKAIFLQNLAPSFSSAFGGYGGVLTLRLAAKPAWRSVIPAKAGIQILLTFYILPYKLIPYGKEG
jgi:hypothetical protein